MELTSTDPGYLQPLCGDGGHPGKLTAGQGLDRPELLQTGDEPGDLTLHADRGSSMSSKALALLLADLGVTKSHSRPHVCDDNPYSEAQFKTLKYRPEFPARLGTIDFCRDFFDWYNRVTRVSACIPPRTCTTAPPSPRVVIEPTYWRPHRHVSQRDFLTANPFRPLFPRPSGSTLPKRRTLEMKLQ